MNNEIEILNIDYPEASGCLGVYRDDPNVFYIYNLKTKEQYRKQGHGTKIVQKLENLAKFLGAKEIRLLSNTDNWIRKWYIRLGYSEYQKENDKDVWLSKTIK